MIYLVYAGLLLFAVALRVLLTVGVAKECDYRQTNSKKLWVALTAIVGFISAVTFVCFVPKKNKSKNSKAIIAVILFFVLIAGAVLYICFCIVPAETNAENEALNSFNYDAVTYEDENGNEIIYDKMGNSYTFEEYIDGYKWYDRDGNSYNAILDEWDCLIGFKCIETGEEFFDGIDGDKSCYIDDEGYLCIFDFLDDDICIYMPDDFSDAVYFDNNGHLYYGINDAYYDEQGKLVLAKGYEFQDFTYSDIPKEEFEYFSY